MGGHLPSKFTTFLHVANPTKGISYNKQQSTQFCHTSCSTHQIDFTGSVQLIKDAQWEKIIQGTKQYAKDKKNIPSSSDIIIISDDEGMPKFNPCTNLIEVDSEEEDTKDRNEDTKDGKGTKLVNAGKVVKAKQSKVLMRTRNLVRTKMQKKMGTGRRKGKRMAKRKRMAQSKRTVKRKRMLKRVPIAKRMMRRTLVVMRKLWMMAPRPPSSHKVSILLCQYLHTLILIYSPTCIITSCTPSFNWAMFLRWSV